MHYGFSLIRDQHIPEIQSHARLLRHIKSGAEYLSIENTDPNKVFGIAFRTPPPDSSGIIHILEHATLQGSRKYPVKSPINELVKGSLKTYINMNAYPDKTVYPVASQNIKDLYNMVDVFLDGVFYPLLTPQTFSQEGWHYQLDNLESALTINGIVYNEQKGNFAMPFKLLAVESQRALFPETIYGHAYGGRPADIPSLTYDQFKAYHQTYYHPSNARIFWYGDDPPEERLRYLNTWLKEFNQVAIDSEIPLQPTFEKPRTVVIPYAAGAGKDTHSSRGYLTQNWMLAEVGDPEIMLALQILEYALTGLPVSPLRKALIDSKLGEDLAGLGLWIHARQMYFSSGLAGINPDDTNRVSRLILETLSDLVNSGFDPGIVAASLNTIEFQLREANFGRYPRGLVLLQDRAMTTWIHGHDPLALLAFEAPLQTIKQKVSTGEPYLERLVQSYFLDNPHRATVLLTPDPDKNLEKEELDRLKKIRASMSDVDLQKCIKDTQSLLAYQQKPDKPEEVAKVPTLKLTDLDMKYKETPIQVNETSGCKTLFHGLSTHDVIYLDLAFDLSHLPQNLIPFAPVFGEALIKMGTSQEDSIGLMQRTGRQTGGITTTLISSAALGKGQTVNRLVLRGKAMVNKASELLEIFDEILLEPRFDNPAHFAQLVLQARARLESNLAPLGFQFTSNRLKAQFCESGWLTEQWTGVEQIFFLRRLEKELQDNWHGVLSRLEEIHQSILNRRALICNTTLNETHWLMFEPKLVRFLSYLPGKQIKKVSRQLTWFQRNEGLIMPSPLNFVGKGANLYDLGYELNGSIGAIVNFINMQWLWEQIRVQGGAYGGRCTFDKNSGMFTYESYRDPHLERTLESYDRTAEFLRYANIPESERIKNIIGAIGQIDNYKMPDMRGLNSMVRYLSGETSEVRQRLREELLNSTSKDFRAFVDFLEYVKERGSVVLLGSRENIQKMNSKKDNWLEMIQVQ